MYLDGWLTLFYLIVQRSSFRFWLWWNKNSTQFGRYKELIIAVPPRNEQLQISEYIDEKLTQYEHLICQAEKLIGTLQERRTALISAAVTGKIDVRNWQAPTVAEADTELSA